MRSKWEWERSATRASARSVRPHEASTRAESWTEATATSAPARRRMSATTAASMGSVPLATGRRTFLGGAAIGGEGRRRRSLEECGEERGSYNKVAAIDGYF